MGKRQARGGGSSQGALLDMLASSLARGHWKVACRRYLMLLACGAEVPGPQRAACEARLRACSEAERARMQADAQAWARCSTRAEAEPPPQDEEEQEPPLAARMPAAHTPLAACAPLPVRTQWRPLPPHFLRLARDAAAAP